MKPFDDLTYLGRIRRMRQLAQSALADYGLRDPSIKFLRYAGNTLFQVNEAVPSLTSRPDVYAPGQYLLRIHQPGYQTPAAITAELEWLISMCQEADLPVPEPVRNRQDGLLTQAAVPGIPEGRPCSLLRWVRGRELSSEEIRPRHYQTLGKLMAKMHHHSSRWRPPGSFSKRKYDWDGLFLKEGNAGILSGEDWSLLPPEYVAPFDNIAQRVRQIMDQLGKDANVYGLIHADLGMGANVIFLNDDARIIDFDDSGFGYYIFDLSIVLEDSQDDQVRPEYRDALLEGYLRSRSLSEIEVKNIDLFLAAYAVYWSLFAADAVRCHPEDRAEIHERMNRYYHLVEHFLALN